MSDTTSDDTVNRSITIPYPLKKLTITLNSVEATNSIAKVGKMESRRYTLSSVQLQTIFLPKNSMIQSTVIFEGNPCLWVLVDCNQEEIEAWEILIKPTGLKSDAPSNLDYCGSYIVNNNSYSLFAGKKLEPKSKKKYWVKLSDDLYVGSCNNSKDFFQAASVGEARGFDSFDEADRLLTRIRDIITFPGSHIIEE